MARLFLLLLVSFLLGLACYVGFGQYFSAKPAVSRDEDEAYYERVVREANVASDTDSLLAYLNKYSLTDDELRSPERLIPRLGSDEFSDREEASRKLVQQGGQVRELLLSA